MIALTLAAALAVAAAPDPAAAVVAPAAAQPGAPARTLERSPTTPSAPAQGPDVELHVPRAEVGKLGLEVENLVTRLDLDTNVSTLVRISAGVVATVQKLKVQMEGVQAETHLVVRLDRVTQVMESALESIDQHPDLAAAEQGAATAPAARVVPATSAAAPSPSGGARAEPGQE